MTENKDTFEDLISDRKGLSISMQNQLNREAYKKVPFIFDTQGGGHENDLKDFYLDKIDEINIKNVFKYTGGIKYRFFYGIYDYKNNKGWIKYHGLKKEEFFIEIGLKEAGFYDCKLPNNGFVCTDFSRRLLREDIKENIVFNNDSDNYLYDLDTLYYNLLSFGARGPFIKHIIPTALKDWIARREHSIFFYNQYKLLKETIKDSDLNSLRESYGKDYKKNLDRQYFDEYGYLPVESYKKRYNEMIQYLGIENRVIYNSNIEIKEKIVNFEDFEKRKNFIFEEYKKLFPNEKFHG